MTPEGVVTTLAGLAGESGGTDGTGSAARFFCPRGVALDNDGNVYVAEEDRHTIRKVTRGGVVTTIMGAARVVEGSGTEGVGSSFNFYAWGIAVDGKGCLYVADIGGGRINKGKPLRSATNRRCSRKATNSTSP